jgi:hypothetical protein
MNTCMAIITKDRAMQSIVLREKGLSFKCIQVKAVKTIIPLENAKNLDGHNASVASYVFFVPYQNSNETGMAKVQDASRALSFQKSQTN